jgi:hypothetical protein
MTRTIPQAIAFHPTLPASGAPGLFKLLGIPGKVGASNMSRPPLDCFDNAEKDRPAGEWFLDPAAVIKRHFNPTGSSRLCAFITRPARSSGEATWHGTETLASSLSPYILTDADAVRVSQASRRTHRLGSIKERD